jgi:hypothetical protein
LQRTSSEQLETGNKQHFQSPSAKNTSTTTTTTNNIATPSPKHQPNLTKLTTTSPEATNRHASTSQTQDGHLNSSVLKLVQPIRASTQTDPLTRAHQQTNNHSHQQTGRTVFNMGLFRRQMQSTGLCRLDNCNNSERSSRRIIEGNEAPFQALGPRTLAATLGLKELASGYFWLSVLSESISCYLYVFIVCATRISWPGSIIGHEPNLLGMAIASGLSMMLLMLIFRTVHVNPALTIAFLLTGRIPLVRAVIYILAQCFGSVAAITLLYSISVTAHTGALGLDNPHQELQTWQIVIIEFMITGMVTLTTYTTCSYSSYMNARQFILEQVGQHCADILDVKSTPYTNENMASLGEVANNHRYQNNDGGLLTTSAIIHHHQQQTHRQRPATASYRNTAPRRPMSSSNLRIHPQSRGYLSDIHENPDFEYEYDSDRIYTHQEQSSPEMSPRTKREPTIEELMHSESQLLAPNGFTLTMTPCQSLCIGLAYALATLTGVSTI